MDLSPTALDDDAEALRLDVRAFLDERRRTDPFKVGLGQGGHHSPDFSRALAARGWVGMTIPRRYGGNERRALDRFVITEELLAAGAPVSAHWVGDRQTAPMLLRLGTEAQRTRFLPAIARGECFFSVGMSEPDAGSDLASVRTTATRAGDGWLLNGTKVWTTYAHRNDFFFVLCRTSPRSEDKHAGLSQMIVDLRSQGVQVNPLRLLNGTESFNEVVLNDVFVPDDMVLGEIGHGWTQVTSELAHERGGPDRYLSTFVVLEQFLGEHAKTDIGRRATEAVGSLVAQYWMLRQLSLSVAQLLDLGRPSAVASAMLKDLGTSFEQRVVEMMHDVVDDEIDPTSASLFEALFADATLMAPSFTIRGGTTEVLRIITARSLRG
jgi:Acyl-CoA dehydrogenase, N-terminal domain/Acyl-CoA dehydrogenase, middle domain